MALRQLLSTDILHISRALSIVRSTRVDPELKKNEILKRKGRETKTLRRARADRRSTWHGTNDRVLFAYISRGYSGIFPRGGRENVL